MATSIPDKIPDIVRLIQKWQPKTVLDVGMGFGKWGFICREYLDIWHKRFEKKDWQTQIVGIDITDVYENPVHKYIYDSYYINDACLVLKNLDTTYDLIIACDVLEHIKKEDAVNLIKNIKNKSKHSILSIPLGKKWLRNRKKIIQYNKYENHISSWSVKDVEELGFFCRGFTKHPRGDIGFFIG